MPAILVIALTALNGILNLIHEVRSQSGMTDDQILAQAQTITGANDKLYATLKAALTTPPAA